MSNQYKIAMGLVAQYHSEQMYGEKPYIYHLLGVVDKVRERGGDVFYQTVALLHDILEDTDCTAHRMRKAGVAEPIIEAVQAITHLPMENRETYLRRCAKNVVALEVKKCDTMFNLEHSFIDSNSKRIVRYTKQLKFLEEYYTGKKK